MTPTPTTPRYSPEDHERMLETLAIDPVQSFVNLPSDICAELRAMLRQAARDAEFRVSVRLAFDALGNTSGDDDHDMLTCLDAVERALHKSEAR